VVPAANHVAQAVLTTGIDMALPGSYFGAGGVAQTVWNLRHRCGPAAGINLRSDETGGSGIRTAGHSGGPGCVERGAEENPARDTGSEGRR
jgi:hypothetical protein